MLIAESHYQIWYKKIKHLYWIANYINTYTLSDELEWRKSGDSQLKWRDIPSINDK